jgi:hypothetical protein
LDYNAKFITNCYLIVTNAQFHLNVENLAENVRRDINIDSSIIKVLKLSILNAIQFLEFMLKQSQIRLVSSVITDSNPLFHLVE